MEWTEKRAPGKSLDLSGPSFLPPGKSKAWFKGPKLGSWQAGAMLGLWDGAPTLYEERGISQHKA